MASAAEKEQHTEHPRQHATVVDKAHGGVIDVASAPCQPSAACLYRSSPRPRWLSIDATGARWAMCTWGLLCDAGICVCRPRAHSTTTNFFADRSRPKKKPAHRTPPSSQSTRRSYRCCICTLPTLRRMTLPAFAAASRRHGLATGASPS